MTSKCIMGFQATDWHRWQSSGFYSWKENSKLNNGGFNKWLEILAGKDLQTKLRKSENVDFKFSVRRQTLWTRDRRLYSDHEYVKRQQQNTTITLQTKPTKWGNTGCRRFSKMRSIEFATKPKRGKFTVKIIFFDATIGSKNYTICKIYMRGIFPTNWGQPISLFTVLHASKFYFTMNSLEQHR